MKIAESQSSEINAVGRPCAEFPNQAFKASPGLAGFQNQPGWCDDDVIMIPHVI